MEKYLLPIIVIAVVAFFYFWFNGASELAKQNIEIAKEFLAINKTKEGVFETSSGLQYKVIISSTDTSAKRISENPKHPTARDKVKVHYHGTLIDGTVFDSSVDRGEPISFGLNQVIKGWTEGVQLMVVGEKTRFFIPSNLAYGNRSTGKIEAGSLLIFEVELLGINE
jgi:peptidylprolyl isomerase